MSANAILRWTGTGLIPSDGGEAEMVAADSWHVADGTSLALGLHRDRFLHATSSLSPDVEAFWDAAITAIPRDGTWFPRVEARRASGQVELVVRIRPAPELRRSITLRTHTGPDPRVQPRVKGPSLERLEALRRNAAASGADDIVILDPLGHIVEGAATAIAWWRGDVLCLPAEELDRVDSVTARALVGTAVALGVGISWETTAPEELDGHEIWALNALHGPRIVTRWIDGPAAAESPGRLALWRARLDALRTPLPAAPAGVQP